MPGPGWCMYSREGRREGGREGRDGGRDRGRQGEGGRGGRGVLEGREGGYCGKERENPSESSGTVGHRLGVTSLNVELRNYVISRITCVRACVCVRVCACACACVCVCVSVCARLCVYLGIHVNVCARPNM